MATLFTSKTDPKEDLQVSNTDLRQYQPVANRTRSSRHVSKLPAETQVEGQVDHARRNIHPTISDGVKVCAWPQRVRSQRVQRHFYQDSDLQLGNKKCGLASPLDTQYFRHDQVWRWSYLQSESSLNRQPCLHHLGKVECCLEPGSISDFDPLTPPPPSDLEALRKTWEQVRLYNMKSLKVSAWTKSSVSYPD